jgi:phosphate acetyltransferase
MATIGDTLVSKSLKVTQELINQYAHICGDYNTLHVDVEGMKNHPLFGGTIAHGTINVEPVLQAICAIQKTTWPKEGTTVDLQFRAPVKPGDTISSKLTVKDAKGSTILVCDMAIANDKGTDCVKGTAEIPVPA